MSQKSNVIDMGLIRKTAEKIVTEIFNKEYTTDNSQTQRFIKEMLEEANIGIAENRGK